MNNFSIKNCYKIYVKLVFILILFVVPFRVYADPVEYKIEFDSHGGDTVSDIYRSSGEEIGTLPTPKRSGYILEGWYLEDTYDTRVTSVYNVTSNTELHANWIEDKFPIVWKKLEQCIFRGKDYNITGEDCSEYSSVKYIDTGIQLYNNTNHGKDYEIGFKIEHYDPGEQDANNTQQTFINTKLEGNNYPGLVFRRNGEKLELASRRTSSANSVHQEKYEDWTDVRIYRVNKVIYYSVNEVEKHSLNTLNSFNPEFELNVWFGAAPINADANTAQRFLNASLSNMYIKLGKYEEKSTYKIYKPDGTIEDVTPYSDYTLDDNDCTKDSENLHTVTFNYHDGRPDTYDYVKKIYIPNGWEVYDNSFDDGDSFRVLKDTVLYPQFDEGTEGVTVDESVTRQGYTFDGWYTQEIGGERVTTYSGNSDITLHAHWIELPSDFEVDQDEITMVVGGVHQVSATFTPSGTTDTLTFSNYDNSIISITNGLITALDEGQTTVTVGLANVPGVTKTITVNVASDKFESNVYEVREASENNDKIIIDAEPGTTVGDFKDNLINLNEFIKVYDLNNNELINSDIVKTGLTIKIEYANITKDEAFIVVRGDTSKDGYVTMVDIIEVDEVCLGEETLSNYPIFAAADVKEDNAINLHDLSDIQDYYLEFKNSLN